MNGNLLVKEHFRSLDSLIRHGEYIRYYYNGNIHMKGSYADGQMDGWWHAYDKEKNYLSAKKAFKSNLRHGKSFTLYENGKPKRIDIFVRDTLIVSDCYDSTGIKVECDSMYSNKPVPDADGIYDKADTNPGFPGGIEALSKFLSKNIKYPAEAEKNELEGKVVVKFTIDEFGNVTNPVILKDGVGGGCAEEALRVCRLMPKWIPGIVGNNPVKVYFTLPITFKLR